MTRLRLADKWCSSADGFTMVEVLVAMVILVIGMLALAGAFDSARKLTLLSERRTEMAHRAQLEIERLQATSYAELAMEKPGPTHSSEQANPDYYVKEGTALEYQYGSKESEAAKIVLATNTGEGIAISPKGRECSKSIGACEWVNGNVSGNVYDFVSRDTEKVTTEKELKPYECTVETSCPKRLTVVVTANVGSGKPPTSIRVSTVITEPISIK